MTALEAALYDATERGWPCVPNYGIRHDGACDCDTRDCPDPGKHPRIRDWPNAASDDPRIIRRWFTRWRCSNRGILTGARSGIVALDVDPDHGGEESLADLEQRYGRLPDTVQSLTGGGGRHVILQHPGFHVHNKIAIAPGLDIRGDGGQIIAAPSLHVSGRRYEWEVSSHPDDVPVAAMPGWLATLISSSSSSTRTVADPVGERIAAGARNGTLASMAGTMRRRGFSVEAIEAALLIENADRCDPPLNPDEVALIARSISRYAPSLSRQPSPHRSSVASRFGSREVAR